MRDHSSTAAAPHTHTHSQSTACARVITLLAGKKKYLLTRLVCSALPRSLRPRLFFCVFFFSFGGFTGLEAFLSIRCHGGQEALDSGRVPWWSHNERNFRPSFP